MSSHNMSSSNISDDDSSVHEFERLESSLPETIKRSGSSLIDLLQVDEGMSSPRYQGLRNYGRSNKQQNLISKLSRSENGRESSPIPLPKPKYNDDIHKPAMNVKQSSTGVLWVTERANEYGFGKSDESDKEWANLGQGAPEHGDTIPNSFKRPTSMQIPDSSKEYAPTAGIKPLREKIANYYNETYRTDKSSKYSWKNVCVVPGGRAGLTRIASIIKDCYLSFFLPDYTAYAEMLSLFKNFSPIPVPLYEEDNYQMKLKLIQNEINRGVSAFLTSNPRNPTGNYIPRDELYQLHKMCREKCLLIMDEFYSYYLYDDGCTGSSISSAEYVKDVNKDPVLIINGLTKGFRLPGWRVCWIVGPEEYINALSSAGSYLDGGTNNPFQHMAINFLDPGFVRNEMKALQIHFKMKRDYVVGRLNKMGFGLNDKNMPHATFYLWLNLSHLPSKLSNCLGFFHECLHEKVIVVPGFFFLINPQNLSNLEDVIWYNFVRISFGPELIQLEKGMDGIERILNRFGCLPYKLEK